MIEKCPLSSEQVHARERDGDWMELTSEQYELIRTCGEGRRCAFIGDELVRMPLPDFTRMLEHAFKAACYSAVRLLGLKRSEELERYDMEDFNMGDRFLSVTAFATDGRSATAHGALVFEETLQ